MTAAREAFEPSGAVVNDCLTTVEALMPAPVGAITKRVDLATRQTSVGPELYERHKGLLPWTELHTTAQMLEVAQAADKAATERERERAAREALKFSVSSHMLLHAGECTAGELRTGKAIANGIAAAIRSGGREE